MQTITTIGLVKRPVGRALAASLGTCERSGNSKNDSKNKDCDIDSSAGSRLKFEALDQPLASGASKA
jgi:hypothetical protein